MSEHTVLVWNEPAVVTVYQESKSVWVASGDYRGEKILVRSASEEAALTLWRWTAEHRGG